MDSSFLKMSFENKWSTRLRNGIYKHNQTNHDDEWKESRTITERREFRNSRRHTKSTHEHRWLLEEIKTENFELWFSDKILCNHCKFDKSAKTAIELLNFIYKTTGFFWNIENHISTSIKSFALRLRTDFNLKHHWTQFESLCNPRIESMVRGHCVIVDLKKLGKILMTDF